MTDKNPSYQGLKSIINELESELWAKGADLELLGRILSSLDTGLSLINPDKTITWVNNKIYEMFPNGNPIGQICHRFYESSDEHCEPCPTLQCFKSGKAHRLERYNSAENKWYSIISQPIKDSTGKVVYVLEGVTDITERKRNNEALRISQGKLRGMLASLTDHMSLIDRDLNIIWANDTAKWLFGEDLIGKKCYQAYHRRETKCQPYPCITLKAFEDSRSHTHETQVLDRTGQMRYFHCTANVALRDENGNPTAVMEISRDITVAKRTEEALRESEEKFRTFIEGSPLGISLIDKEGRYKYVNPAFGEMFGYTIGDVPTGNEWFKKAYPNKTYRHQAIRFWIEDKNQSSVGQARPRVYTVTCKDGSLKEIQFRPVTLENLDQFVIYEDITERARMERQFLQAQKFEAIGTLAGGVAHDFNNLLMGIQGRASLMAVELGPFHPQRDHLEAIEEYVRSARNLTKQLLGFARGGKYEVKPFNLNELVLASAAMFGRTRKEIQIHTKILQSFLVVEADRQQIEQVLLNMYVNAWQAMPDGGELYLETLIVELDEETCKPHKVEPGRYGKISVTDTGTGMDETTRQRIFDPFFTTKERSRGTGLGLASAYSIIKNHAGIITVYSEVGHGTTFNLYLPLSDQKVPPEDPAERSLIKGSETILLVDDEAMIRDVGQAMLETLGYRVIVANGGEQAVERIAEIGNEIDLVILDLIMPGVDGGTTFDRIRENKPTIPVLLSSGYAINGQTNKVISRGCNGFIQKPYNITELSEKVRKILQETKYSDRS